MNTLISVAGGMIAVYAIFALITSHIGEWIGQAGNKRGQTLYEGIQALLAGTKQIAAVADVAVPGASGEIAKVTADIAKVTDPKSAGKTLADYLYAHPNIGNLGTKDKPSYIPARTFTLSLIGALRDFDTDAQGGTVTRPMPSLSATPAQLLIDLNSRIEALPADNPLRKSLTLVIEGAEAKYDTVLKGIDEWYESQMDRIGGNYRRWSGRWQTIIALIAVALFNVDTIALAHAFLQSTAIADAAAQLARGVDPAKADASKLLTDVVSAKIPIGWVKPFPCGGSEWLTKIAGIIISWFAVMLGAPFWFDLLKKIVPVRATGTKPAPGGKAAKRDAQSRDTSA